MIVIVKSYVRTMLFATITIANAWKGKQETYVSIKLENL